MAWMAVPKGARTTITGKYYDNDPLSLTYGQLVDPATVFFHYKPPGGANVQLTYGVDAALVRKSVGFFQVDVDFDTVGDWLLKWRSIGVGKAATPDITVEVTPSAF
jgi:hypothetical protein